ncbi:MAG TPA: TolC family protein [Candidatus Eisenbacteria bacterium]|jgi:outer membrane protein TolC|nr:TolC family protein [Candidatus Eisenbacteria bacterium]
MKLSWLTAQQTRKGATTQRSNPKFVSRQLLAALVAGLMMAGPSWPVFAQEPGGSPPPGQQQQRPPLPTPQSPEQNRPSQDPNAATQQPTPAYGPAPANPPIPVALGVYQHRYDKAPKPFPNLIAPYRSIGIPALTLTNSPRVDQLVQNGKLQLTLQDAVELALENSMDIVVQRYNTWFGDTDILQTEGGGLPFGVSGAEIRQSTASIPFLNYDPTITQSVFFDNRITAVNNPLVSGTGQSLAQAASLGSHTAQYNTGYSQGFSTGTTLNAAWNNMRESSSSTFNFFNPDVVSLLSISISQQLLNGFGRYANRRNIMIAKNNRKLADLVFAQQAITTVTNTVTAYWELVYATEAVRVQEQAVTVSTKLYNDNRKQLEIGTLAPLEVTRSEAQLAGDRQNLILAQTVKLQDEQVLKNAISKDPLAANLVNVEIIPLDKPTPPEAIEAPTFEEAVKEAFAKRPDLQEQALNVANAGIDAKATANALLPVATLTATYSSSGLAGNSIVPGATTTTAGTTIVGANGQPVTVLDATGTPVEIFVPTSTTAVAGVSHQGFGDSQSQIFHNTFPSYTAGVTLQLPLRNRQAQATNQRAILQLRQIEAQMQQLKNAALLDVRNTYIALEQDRARVQAASKARELQQQTFDAEQKRYQLGASTVYNVILTQRDLISAQGAELRALADLVEAKANYERAVGRTLEVNRVTIADAKHGQVERDTLIPGTMNGQVVGTEKLWTDTPSASSNQK